MAAASARPLPRSLAAAPAPGFLNSDDIFARVGDTVTDTSGMSWDELCGLSVWDELCARAMANAALKAAPSVTWAPVRVRVAHGTDGRGVELSDVYTIRVQVMSDDEACSVVREDASCTEAAGQLPPNATCLEDDGSQVSVLALAVARRSLACVHALLSFGADATAAGVFDSAVATGDPRIAAAFLSAGALPSMRSLSSAATACNLEMFGLLSDNLLSEHMLASSDEVDLMWVALCTYAHVRANVCAAIEDDTLALVLPPVLYTRWGVDIPSCEHGSLSPLELAAKLDKPEYVTLLVAHGASTAHWRPLAIAAERGALSVVETLLQLGADKDAASPTGATALMFAASACRHDVFKCLVDAGASTLRSKQDGATATDLWKANCGSLYSF